MTGQTVLDRTRIAAQIRRHSGSVPGLRKSGTTGPSVTGILIVIGRVGPGLHAPENVVLIEVGGVRQLELPTVARTGSSTSEWLKVDQNAFQLDLGQIIQWTRPVFGNGAVPLLEQQNDLAIWPELYIQLIGARTPF